MRKLKRYIHQKFLRGFHFLIIPNNPNSKFGPMKSIVISFTASLLIFGIIIFNIYIFVDYSIKIWQIHQYRQEIRVKELSIKRLEEGLKTEEKIVAREQIELVLKKQQEKLRKARLELKKLETEQQVKVNELTRLKKENEQLEEVIKTKRETVETLIVYYDKLQKQKERWSFIQGIFTGIIQSIILIYLSRLYKKVKKKILNRIKSKNNSFITG